MSLIPLAIAVGFTLGLITAYVAQYRTPCGNNSIGHRLAHITETHTLSICFKEFGRVASIGFTEGLRKGSDSMAEFITHEDVNYRKVERKAEVGDLIAYRDADGPTGISRVMRRDFDADDFYVEDGTYIWVALGDAYNVLEVAEPQPDVHALIANLGRRLHEIEKAITPEKSDEFNHCSLSVSYEKGKAVVEVTFDELSTDDLVTERAIAVIKELSKR